MRAGTANHGFALGRKDAGDGTASVPSERVSPCSDDSWPVLRPERDHNASLPGLPRREGAAHRPVSFFLVNTEGRSIPRHSFTLACHWRMPFSWAEA